MSSVLPFMSAPVPLLSDIGGKWEISNEAVEILNRIDVPVSVVAIVGKYRTGKSFLMNRLAGESSGFKLGSKVEAQTKGIWMWARPHQKDPSRCLILLDTEGLYDVELSDQKRDMQLFTFSVLLSSCLVFNAVGSIDSNFIQELGLIAELTESIKVTTGDNAEEESGAEFSTYFPSLFVVLRDFQLQLEIKGKEMSSDEYLSNALLSKKGKAQSTLQYNAPREAITNYFQRRRCFALPRPVSDDEQLANLDKEGVEIRPDFLAKAELTIDAILDEATPMDMDGNILNGSRYMNLVKIYAKSVNDGGVPCIESAIDIMKKNQCEQAYMFACEQYTRELESRTKDQLPIPLDQLDMMHSDLRTDALEQYRKKAITDEKDEFIVKLQESIDQRYQLKKKENDDISVEKSNKAIETSFKEVEKGIESGVYNVPGGYSKYKEKKEQAISNYKKTTNLGPMMDTVLHTYLKSQTASEKGIMASDKRLSEEEKQREIREQELQQQQEQQRLEAEKLKEETEGMQSKIEEQKKLHEKLAQDNEEKFQRMEQKQKDAILEKENQMKDLLSKGLQKQADEYKEQIQILEQKRAEREKEQENQRKLEETQRREHERHQKDLFEMQRTRDREQAEMNNKFMTMMMESKRQEDQRRDDNEERQRQRDREDRAHQEKQREADRRFQLDLEAKREKRELEKEKKEEARRQSEKEARVEQEKRREADRVRQEERAERERKAEADRLLQQQLASEKRILREKEIAAEKQRRQEEKDDRGVVKKALGFLW